MMKNKYLQGKYEEFHKGARVQKRVPSSNDFTYSKIFSMINKHLRPNMKVLDIGCGVGSISLYVAGRAKTVLGVDLSERAINMARGSAEISDIKNISFRALNFMEMELGEEFDFVICSEVLEHLPDDRSALQRIYKLLRRGGVVLLSVPSQDAPLHKLRKFLFEKDIFDERVGHLRRYSIKELKELLEDEQFKILETQLTEGVLKNLLFTTIVGNRLVRVANIPGIKQVVVLIDDILASILGKSQIIMVAERK